MSGTGTHPAVAPAPGASPTADVALVLAARAWAGGDAESDRLWARLDPAWAARLRARRAGLDGDESLAPEAARDRLLRDHAASARPDPARVHPSWFVRAIRPETRAVRGTVLARAPEAIRALLGRDETDPAGPGRSDPDAVACALALWSERLVGDVGPRDDDPLIVVALTQLHPRARARLARAAGQVKHAFAGATRGGGPPPVDEAGLRLKPPDRVRLAFFRRRIGMADPRLVPLARADLRAVGADPRRLHDRLGLVTAGRLLAAVEPYRARWSLQHIPYAVAKRTRTAPAPGLPARALVAWESWVLEAAWARLHSEGRIPAPPERFQAAEAAGRGGRA